MARTRMSWRGDLITALLSAWLIGGLFLDGWAHNTGELVETFFTPWHAVLYSGFLALAGWICWSVWSRHRLGATWTDSVPVGYGLALAGIVLFGGSGLADMSWHLAFGIEEDLAALLSPPHLALFTGGLLMVTAPLRSLWADPLCGCEAGTRELLPALLSAGIAGSGVGFFFMYLHPVADNRVTVGRARFLDGLAGQNWFGYVYEQNIALGIAGFILATLFLLGPAVILLRRWDLPSGSLLLTAGVQLVLIQAVTGFAEPRLVVLGLAGTLAVEALLRILRPSATAPGRLRAFAAAAPVALWGVWLGGIALDDGALGWPPEVWGAALVWSGLTLLGLALLVQPAPVPVAATESARASVRT